MNQFDCQKIENILKIKFKDKNILKNAFIHSSFANENKIKSNERLEFLGDSVLSIIVTDYLYKNLKGNEGSLSKIRASLVSEKTLSFIFKELKLDEFLLVGAGLYGKEPTVAMMADAMESVIAAIYLDQGLEQARKFVLNILEDSIKSIKETGVPESHKSLLQEKFKSDKIVYLFSTSGEGSEKTYVAHVLINGVMCGVGMASKKRQAEENAAFEALKDIKKN